MMPRATLGELGPLARSRSPLEAAGAILLAITASALTAPWRRPLLLAGAGGLLLAMAPGTLAAQRSSADTVLTAGLEAPVEILKDRWGVSHIYAQSEHDLFFAQGYNAARDRLFQLEMWRRRATGTMAEILGPDELPRDRGARLFMFRGDLDAELAHYHPRGKAIVQGFVDGVNARVREALDDRSLRSVEFEILGMEPGLWTPAVVISRHQGLLGNIGDELRVGRAVARSGPDAVERVSWFHPGEPELALHESIDGDLLFDDILGLYDAFRDGVRFSPDDIAPGFRRAALDAADPAVRLSGDARAPDPLGGMPVVNAEDLGSNNWVVSGRLTESGYPIMANDPHRAQAAPSLRYVVHLNGPGWNVVGGGEPTIPGVSIGHNDYGAWGLTVFRTDGEDLYVYDTHPDDPTRYRYGDGWERMTLITESIAVEGADDVEVELRYTRHGPIVYEDTDHHKAYAVRAAWMEIGGAPYLASLRMDQATSWEEFRDACTYSNIPGENMIWAGRDGTIGWQSVGIAPIRRTWSGLVPVPGDGRYEWDGYLPIAEKPHTVDPSEEFFATANNNLTPPDYPHMDAIGFSWSDPYRWARVSEVLASGRRLSMADMMRLQTDVLSIPARTLVPLLEQVVIHNPAVERARLRLVEWDYRLEATSVEAGIYAGWERQLRRAVHEVMVPPAVREWVPTIPMKKVVDWMLVPPGELGTDPLAARDALLVESLIRAVAELTDRFGGEPSAWVYGQAEYKHATIRHPLSQAVDDATRQRLDVGPAPRGGNSYTVNNTGEGDNQTSGASFRIIVDTSDWDLTVAANNPGQGGDPDGPHYDDLFDLWASDRFFPLPYSRGAVEAATGSRLVLAPGR
jgi:penicillin amidase